MTLAHQSTTVSAVTTPATAPVIAWPASLAAGDLVVMEINTKPVGTTTSGTSEGPLNVATLRNNGWILLGTRNNGTTAATTDLGSTRIYILAYIAAGTETGNIAGIALTSADSTGVTAHRYTRDTSKELSLAVAFGQDTTSGTGWSITFDTNPGLKAGDKLLLIGGVPTDAVATWSAPVLSAAGATFSQVAQRTNLNTTTGTDNGLRVAEWDVSTGPATAVPTWAQTLSSATTGTGGLLRMREVAPDPQGPIDVSTQVVDIPSGTGSVSATPITMQTGDIMVAILSDEGAPISPTISENGSNTAGVKESRITNPGSSASGIMWTYEALTNETVTFQFDNGAALHSRVRMWHVRGGTLTGATSVSAQDTASGDPRVTLPSLPTDALVLGSLSDWTASSNVGAYLRWDAAEDIVVDADYWVNGISRWVSWHAWQNATGTVQGPNNPAMRATTFAIAIPPAPTGPAPAATQDSTALGDVAAVRKNAAKTTAESSTLGDRPLGSKTLSRSTVDSTALGDRVVSGKSPAGTVADNPAPTDRVVSGRSSARSTVDSTTPGDTAVGRKTPARSTTETSSPTDRPLGIKQASGSTTTNVGPVSRAAVPMKAPSWPTSDSASPTSTGVGRKAASGSTAESIVPAGRPVGTKARTGATADTAGAYGIASHGFAVFRGLVDSASPQDATAGRKTARGSTGTGGTPTGRPQGSRAAARAASDAVSPAARPTGRKSGVTVGTTLVGPRAVLAGRKSTTRATSDSPALMGVVLVRRGGVGSTRSSTGIDEVIVRTLIHRDVTIMGGRLRRYRAAGLLRPRFVGRYARRPTGTAGGTAPEGDLREHS